MTWPQKRWTPAMQEEAENLRNEGHTYAAIAKKLGVAHTTILRHLNHQYYNRERIQYNERRKEFRQNPEYRNSERRKTTDFVYALISPSNKLLKIGKSSSFSEHIINTKARLRERNLPDDDVVQIWHIPGDHRHEAFIQAYLSFRFTQPFGNYRRISEWFSVGDTEPEAIVAELDRIYSLVPSG